MAVRIIHSALQRFIDRSYSGILPMARNERVLLAVSPAIHGIHTHNVGRISIGIMIKISEKMNECKQVVERNYEIIH